MPDTVQKEGSRTNIYKNQIKRFKVIITIAMGFYLVFASIPLLLAFDGKGPRAGLKSLDQNGRMRISPKDRCPVCGMKVIRYPKFAGAIKLMDNTTYYFCSTGCMIRSWIHPEIYLGALPSMRYLPVVREYFTGRHVDARGVIFVYGSDVVGPMGPALVPVMDQKSLIVFKKRHGGAQEFLLNNLNDVKWFEMTGKNMVKQ